MSRDEGAITKVLEQLAHLTIGLMNVFDQLLQSFLIGITTQGI